MKIAIMNFSGNVGKTTVAAHLLKPRIPQAVVYSVESINTGADASGLEVEKLKDMVGDLAFCDACFTGNYPMEVPGRDISLAFE